MQKLLRDDGDGRTEGLRQPSPSSRSAGPRLRIGHGAEGIERLEASLLGQAFSPHRHDTYAIGVTLSGVQTFTYRGERRHCLPGEGHILHPDELHDGGAGTDDGFAYRIIYIDPMLVQEALGGKPLPFVADPVIGRHAIEPALTACLSHIYEPIADVARIETAQMIADMLERLSAAPPGCHAPLHLTALRRVRDLITDDPTVQHPVADFERASGLDRWTISRQFRAAFGTSPSRFRTMRQLDLARRMMAQGMALCDAALGAGFADQSHMTRMFKRTYGLTPARWSAAVAAE